MVEVARPPAHQARRTVELQDYLTVARKRWRVIALVTLLVLGVAAAGSALATKVYESRTQFFVSITGANDSGALLQGSTFTQQRVKSYAQLLTTPRVLDQVAQATGVDASDLDERVTATTPPDTVLIDVAVRDPDPEAARAVAAAIAEVFPDTVTELESPAGGESSPVKVTVVQPPSIPDAPVSPQPLRNIAIGLVLGLLAGLGAATLRETLDRTVKTLDDLKAVSTRPVLGVIAFDSDAAKRPLIVEVDPRSPRSEAFRALRTNLTFIDAADHPETIVVTSSLAGEGKSTVTMNLAMTMAQADARVCLIEADLRRPKVLDYMGMDGSLGLTDALIGHAHAVDVLQQYGDTNLWVMGAGAIPPNPSELLGSNQMRAVLTELLRHFDQVIIDAPPVLPVTDAVVLSKIVDGAIVVAGSGLVETEQLQHTLETLESVNGRVLGLILNRVPRSTGTQYARYSYEYSLPEDEATRNELRRARRTEPV
jgi:capsular exopolysaccharide synthesis family protein